MSVDVILGTAGFGYHGRIPTVSLAKEFLDTFKQRGYNVVDTAFVYPGGFQGESETMLGVLEVDKHGFLIDTKVRSFAAQSHTPDSIFLSVEEQFKRLKVSKVRTLYLHCPDRATPFKDTHKAMDDLYKQGKFERFGLSNFTAKEVELFVQSAKENGWVTPTVYQGLYNLVSRLNEYELFPVLKKHNINFFVYSPLAVGFFSNVRRGQEPGLGSRFDPNTRQGRRLRERYFKESFFDAVERIEKVGAKYGISNNSIALRWLMHHSELSDGDAIIIGASKIQQVQENLSSLSEGVLPQEILDVVNEVWESVKDDAPAYSR
ncbi:NADP-dependent oxidoreductase domain-containing protein [Lipomyces tetrasporus]|uniref:NADP-dependent oxidoreductase domain-containing protein n=1 Tax=Lipomyces tetrasporus TaxID=54092 RepID=A0AAD7QPZ2_9ASCO|nr:NADP-dependent oxidoreductase domain-containing protein [Lipomyces tetrasporus]KAJ8098826.1 NADP-dependent oxidoreductase domain-containing protein [Lipomyces tetrasporus]